MAHSPFPDSCHFSGDVRDGTGEPQQSSDMSTKREPPSILKVFPYSTLGILAVLMAVNREMVSDMLQVSAEYWEVDRWVIIVASIVCVVVLMAIAQGLWTLYYHYLNHRLAVKDAQELYEKERNALIALFNALDGKRWKDKTRWCSDEPIEKWKGVKLDRVTGRVNKLLLAENELGGKSQLAGDFTQCYCNRLSWSF